MWLPGAGRYARWPFAAALACGLLLVAGCHRLEVGPPLAAGERQAVAGRFFRLAGPVAGCAALDAEVRVSAPSWLGRRIFSGYLTAQEPAFARVVFLAPLGQPLALFVTDGRTYQYVDTSRRRAWRGRLAGWPSGGLYALLTGRPVACAGGPAGLEVRPLAGRGDSGYLIAYQCSQAGLRYEYWFDGRAQRVRRARLLANGGEEPLLTVTYASYQEAEAAGRDAACPVPARMRLAAGRWVVEVILDDPVAGQAYGAADFRISVPDGYAVEEGPSHLLGAGG